ncbi:hypothetical protein OGM23_20670 [Dickeya fangzhongdai]|uniref:hypothetical protein n=1 Tax=Dickeya fangzhongdai TaxID=1778540 RepID=UPI002B320C9C|nr:hypothetical protein OGM23_20670 [Dickeya fangzhongdai]
MTIPENIQIDAILSGRIYNLVARYCEGEWGTLKARWTVPFEAIIQEAERRGLACFVMQRPHSEGFWLTETASRYEVNYTERGITSLQQTFPTLAPAFRYWLQQTLCFHNLPYLGAES